MGVFRHSWKKTTSYALVFLHKSNPTAAGSGAGPTQDGAGGSNRGLIVVLFVLLVILVSVVLAGRRHARKLAP